MQEAQAKMSLYFKFTPSQTQRNDINNTPETDLLYRQFVAWSCNGCMRAPLTDFINNPVYMELHEESEYFSASDERIYLDLGASYGYSKGMQKIERNDSNLNLKIQLKSALAKNLRLRIWEYSMGEYL